MTFASVESTQDHESSISDPISYNSTNYQVTVNLPTLCSKDNSSTGKAGCRTQTLEKKELPSLWQDSKSCSEIRQEKLTSNQEKQLLKESADFLGEDFNAFSRRSQRKRGVPKKLENYLSECGDVSEAIQTPVNKRKKQKTKSDVEVGNRTFDSTYNDSSWNRVYQDDVVVEGENPSTNLEIEARYQKKTNENCSHKEDHDIGIDDDRLLKSTLPCTRSMLKRLTSNLVPRSTQKRTRLRSQETQLTSSDIGVNTDLSDDTDTLDNCDNNSTDIPMYSVTLEENSNLPTKGNMGDSISDRTTDLVTPARNRGPVTQNCTVCITREDTIMEGQSLTSGDMITWTENLESSKVSNTGDHEETPVLTTCEVRSYNVHNIKRNKRKSKKSFEKSVSFSQGPAKKKKGRPLKNLRSVPKKATLMGTEANNVSGHFGGKNAESVEEHESAITTELESAHSPLPEKPKKNNNEKREITLLSKGKSKKRKIERMEKSDLPGFDVKENSLAVAEVDTNQSVKKKSKNKNIVGKREPGGDPTRPKSKKKKSHGKKNSKEKTDDGSLSKEHSSANSLEKCHLKQNYDGKDTSSKKKYTLKNDNDTDLKKKNNSKGGKKALGKISNSQSNNFTKQIHNIAAKNKRRILDDYAKFRIITNPSQGAELMSNRPVDCRFCKETFAFSTLKVHEKEHQFKCIRCCLFFSTKKEKSEHVIKEHKNSEKPKKTSQVSKLRELFHCMLCEKSFVTIKVFQRHLQTSIHGYNRHIQNRCLNMIGSHFHQPSQTKHGTLYAIDNGEEEGEQLLQQQNTWCRAEDKSLKMWTLPENLISIEELEKQFIKAVESDKNVIHYYYREPELLEVIKKQEILLQNVSASSDEERQSEEPYAVVTNFSMMKFLTACTQGSDYVARQEAGSIQCMHNNPADCSTSYTDPAGGSTNYTDPAGGSTNYTDSAVASASSTQTFSAESRSHSLPDCESAGYSEMKTMSHCDTNQTNTYSEEIAAQVLVPDRLGNSVAHNNLSLVPIQSNLDNSYQLSDEGNLPCQLMRNSSRILSTSGSDHSDMDQDQGQMGWLSRAIEDIEADPYYRVHDFLDSQSDMYNVSGFNELSTSKNSPVLRYTSTPSTSTRCTVATDTRSFTDLDSGQQIQVCNNTCPETPGHCGNGTRDIFPVECLDSCRSKESSTHVLGPLNSYSSSRESQFNCKDDDDDPESQELIKLKYAQILCDIRNDVLGTRSGQE
ncbi:uncharacterized protein LOC117338638 [Pecten maximus]|uniref:uncharacterized protein LOC117338638 n=1 Tax=Pecten maximus TaxID=6579 RepID=UPI0014583EA9|nr:uncharacterized protein LOC117338638 [Pecten maximus]